MHQGLQTYIYLFKYLCIKDFVEYTDGKVAIYGKKCESVTIHFEISSQQKRIFTCRFSQNIENDLTIIRNNVCLYIR